jgi:hypothetical protein
VPDVEEITLLPVRTGGFTCWCDTLRSYAGEVVLMSLYGPRNAVRAVWAKLNSSERRNPTIEIGGGEYGRAQGVLYATINTPMGGGSDLHTILVDRRATRGGEDKKFYYQVGPDPERRFFARLAERCPLPLRSAWAPDLWELGQATTEDESSSPTITKLAGHGLPVYRVATDGASWGPLVKAALLEGKLT